MSKKEDFLTELEDLLRKYDVEEREVDIYIEADGGEAVITVDMPKRMEGLAGFQSRFDGVNDVVWESFILPDRPFDGRRD